ncbi:hypothetical protein HG535_0H02490 [Zygotorulaspora mrakii]|uniref:Palmitoyltransferase n=1 Tax=Zygotorulaspora mrakii TaxID=42260 RepID=A0A7H9BAZ8_ZYGMR|nr:uncharacterized protein HG535_0H02490 [Zygotorulaspora mrakii]QLG74922.1 hypothetical protein HG535_0H02490 [Zygotorulaspora mrakii]
MSVEESIKSNDPKIGALGAEDDVIQDDVSLSSMLPVISSEERTADVDKTLPIQSNDSDAAEAESVNSELQRYHVACQKGDLTTVKQMTEGGLVDIKKDYDDGEGVTGLHWASINNRLSVVDYLVTNGANVNAKAGTLHAPPIHWAARYGYVYIVDYLLKHGADAKLKDDQGFNLLHISVNSSNIMLILYVLFFVVDKDIIDVDSQDPHGRTSLLWAAYQGDSLTVDSLLRFGAYVKIADEGGFTPLHWGTLRGQPHVLMYLIKKGADFFQKTNDGKDCFTIAQEMNTVYSLNEAMRHCGFNAQGYPIRKFFEKSLHAKAFTFFVPWVFLGVALSFFSHVHILLSFPVILAFGLALQVALKRFVLPSYQNTGVSPLTLIKTPIFAGVFSGSVYWVFMVWIIRVFPATIGDKPLENLSLLLSIITLGYLFIKLLKSDPGRVPAETNHARVRETIEDLLKLGAYDTRHFCIETWIRKPLRSKFSSLSNSLVARFDHFCPWVYNDIGLKNHKVFIFFIATMELAVWIFTHLCLEYFDGLEDIYEDESGKVQCFLISDDDICAGLKYDLFTSLTLIWALLQAVWVAFVILVQLFQIFKGVTNYEFSKLMKDSKRANTDSVVFNEFFNTTPEDFVAVNGDIFENSSHGMESIARTPAPIKSSKRCCGFCCAITGMDQWLMVMKETMGIARNGSGSEHSLILSSPTNYGWKTNVKDFWLTSDATAPIWQRVLYSPQNSTALLGGTVVDYYELYKFPPRALDFGTPLDV